MYDGVPAANTPVQAHADPDPALPSSTMKLFNTIALVVGWIFVVFAVLSALGLGSIHMHLGPLDFKLPFHWR